jgi:hypothetical protein
VTVTERPEDVAQVAEAQARGEAAEADVTAHAEAMLRIRGGGVDVTDANRSLDDQAVPGIGTPSRPSAVSPQPTSSPNVRNPTG